jgi:hypothetical protein
MELKKKINHQALSSGRKPSAFSLFALLLSLLLSLGCFFPALYDVARAADKSEEEILKEQLQQREEKLWQNANKDLQAGKDQEAADFFYSIISNIPIRHGRRRLYGRRQISSGSLPLAVLMPTGRKFRNCSAPLPLIIRNHPICLMPIMRWQTPIIRCVSTGKPLPISVFLSSVLLIHRGRMRPCT